MVPRLRTYIFGCVCRVCADSRPASRSVRPLRPSALFCSLLFLPGVDGAYFGTTFPHLFFMTYKGLVPDPPEKTYVPKVFGFRVHARSSPGGAPARGQNEQQALQERRRPERQRPPQSPQTPPQQPSGAAAAAGAAGPVGARAGSSPPNGTMAAGEGGDGKGRGKGRAEGGSVVVRIKEEEENWTKGRGGDARGAIAGVEGGSATVAAAVAAAAAAGISSQQGVNGEQVGGADAGTRGGGTCRESRGGDNGHEAW